MDITVIITKLKEAMDDIFAKKEDVPTKVSDIANDLNFIMKSEVRNNLLSSDTQLPLSANQGRILKNSVDTKSDANHTHVNISDTGWQNVVLKDGFANYSASSPARYRRIGKIVHLEGIVKNTTAFTSNTQAITMGIIDDQYCRPTNTQYAIMQGTDANKFLLSIDKDGNIGISRYSTNSLGAQVNANAWLHVYATWMVETENISIPTSMDTEFKAFENMTLSNNNTILNATIRVEATLKDQDGNYLANKAIKILINNDVLKTEMTDYNGIATFAVPGSLHISNGTITDTMKCVFEKDETYRAYEKKVTI